MPKQVSTNCKTFDNQYEANYNFHSSANGLIGDFIKSELRSRNIYTARQVTRLLGEIISRYYRKYPKVDRFIRADSGFATLDLYKLIEDNKVFYEIILRDYKTLYTKVINITACMELTCKENIYGYKVVYDEIRYKACKWDKERRGKIEKPEGQLDFNYTFVITNMTSTPKNVIIFYFDRRTMENFIKESKNCSKNC